MNPFVALAWVMLITCSEFVYTDSVAATGESAGNAEREWVVVLNDPRPARLRGFNVNGYSSQQYQHSLALRRYGKRFSKEHDLNLKKAWFINSLNVYCIIVSVHQNNTHKMNELREDRRVAWVQNSNDFNLLSTSLAPVSTARESSLSYDSGINGAGVRIALIDSAVARDHPSLRHSINENRDLVIGGKPTNGSGEKHGTAMAGILSASSDDGLSASGVAPGADVLAYRGCWESNTGDTHCNTLSLARALDALLLHNNVSILNLSLSGPSDRLLETMIEQVVSQGTLVVAAFDPNRSGKNRFPSNRKGVLIVRAENIDDDSRGYFTAPGQRLVLSPNSSLQVMTGHSVAAAYTSGVLALLVQSTDLVASGGLIQLIEKISTDTLINAQVLLQLSEAAAKRD